MNFSIPAEALQASAATASAATAAGYGCDLVRVVSNPDPNTVRLREFEATLDTWLDGRRRDLSSQINIQIPSDLADGPHTFQVHRMNLDGAVESTSAAFTIEVNGASPTYFGSDALPVFIRNVTQNPAGRVLVSGNAPAAPPDVGVIHATGLGETDPPLETGEEPPAGVTAHVLLPIVVVVRSRASQWTAEFLGAAASPQFPGAYQVAISVSGHPADGTVDLILAAGQDQQTFRANFVSR